MENECCIGVKDVEYAGDPRWAVVTKDRQYAAHFEHTIAITEDGPEILTPFMV